MPFRSKNPDQEVLKMEMSRNREIVLIGIAACAILALIIILLTGVIGISANNITQDARKSQKIDGAWDMSGSSNNAMAAMIFYNETLDDHTFSLYLDRGGLSFGYFFREGGSNSTIENGILMLEYGTNGSAIFSMNKERVGRIEHSDGGDLAEIYVDPSRPFAVVLPANHGSVKLFSDSGNDVPITLTERRS